jgi:hypothetical protein
MILWIKSTGNKSKNRQIAYQTKASAQHRKQSTVKRQPVEWKRILETIYLKSD